MGSVQNRVHYCCVYRANKTIYVYSVGDREVENMAALCLEVPPSHHKWYFETIGLKTFGFLIEGGYIYFVIVDAGLGNLRVLDFLEHVRDEFRKVVRSGSRESLSINMEEQLVPVIHHLIISLGVYPSPIIANGQTNAASTSTKAPLLGKSSKQDKKKAKDNLIAMEKQEKSIDRQVNTTDSTALDASSSSSRGVPAMSLHKDIGSMRTRPGSRNIQSKWWRQVRIVVAIDVAVCVVLLVIWLIVCRGLECTRS